MKDTYRVETEPMALQENIIQGDKYRITILTDKLIRFEYSEDGIFENRATQMVFYRNFPKTTYRMIRTKDSLEIHTLYLHITYNEKDFSSNGLFIQLKGNVSNYRSMWRYGEKIENLGGTARTLDEANGEIELENGIISRTGCAVLDDSKSLVLSEDGWIETRKRDRKDFYFFGYGHEYKEALKDFYYLCGRTPMLPRYVLGNWWSRYYKYTEESYMNLMDKFEKQNLPFTVAVIDMDWHLVDIDERYGSGWTGYTWNKELFPNPRRFLSRLHDKGLHTTLNLHPADGVRAHEEMYQNMAEAMGIDYTKEDPISCDLANPDYMEAYFKYLHHPREEEGVDFWWIDWQQGNTSKVEGLDPLWMLNHFHFLDSKRNGKRPLIFSRYAGPGSHRYPVGFSGDTITTWESLDFQPCFTSTATNIGYGWWSHDIGGHMLGYKDDEMTARWTQFGIYSPIMRLHSSSSEFNSKEPWRYKKETEEVMKDALRERHRMLPYLYTMNYRNYKEGIPLILPMYYEYPDKEEAYQVKNQYMFGSELIVAPITTPRYKGINKAKIKVWLPDGIWYDIHTGMMYSGNKTIYMYRDIYSIPVLAKAGAILPFTEEISGKQAEKNPEHLHIKVFTGKSGSFTLYEDDNESCAYEKGICVKTKIEYIEAEEASLVIHKAEGKLNLIPEKREYLLEIVGVQKIEEENIRVLIEEKDIKTEVTYSSDNQSIRVKIPAVSVDQCVKIIIKSNILQNTNSIVDRCFEFLNQAEIEFSIKDKIFSLIKKYNNIAELLSEIYSLDIEQELYGALVEILTATQN